MKPQPALDTFSVRTIDGRPASLGDYRGKVLLIVNVASKCGMTPQYGVLEAMYEKYQGRGLEVLGFPANDFEEQEPGTNAEIQDFCRSNYGVKFPMFEKIAVVGPNQHPLYRHLTDSEPKTQMRPGKDYEEILKGYGITRAKNNDILWNFEKFLVNREGRVIGRFSPDMSPDDPIILGAIEAAL